MIETAVCVKTQVHTDRDRYTSVGIGTCAHIVRDTSVGIDKGAHR